MNCCVCEKQGITPKGEEGGKDYPDVCDQCQSDARLGRAVRNLKNGWSVCGAHGGFFPIQIKVADGRNPFGDPMEALQAAGLVKP